MKKAKIHRGYVRVTSGRNTGTILVQIPDDSRHGFYLADDDQSWPGGFGIAQEWEAVKESEVSEEDRKRLGWILEQ